MPDKNREDESQRASSNESRIAPTNVSMDLYPLRGKERTGHGETEKNGQRERGGKRGIERERERERRYRYLDE